jgi:predicted HTH domain antitoxin
MPKGIAPKFGADPEAIGHRVIEQAAAEGYRSRQLSRGQVAELPGLDWEETEDFLARPHCDRRYDREDLEEDRRNLDKILGPSGSWSSPTPRQSITSSWPARFMSCRSCSPRSLSLMTFATPVARSPGRLLAFHGAVRQGPTGIHHIADVPVESFFLAV